MLGVVFPEFVGKRPLLLGEGWGEGLATKTQNTSFSFFIGADRKKDGGEFSFLVYSATPSPRPSPKGEGVTYKFLAHWLIRNHWLLQSDRRMFSRL